MRNFAKKLEYCFLVETTKIENTTFLYKTVLSEANAKAELSPSKKISSTCFNQSSLKMIKTALYLS